MKKAKTRSLQVTSSEYVLPHDDLRKSEARYRALSEATFEAIFISESGLSIDTTSGSNWTKMHLP
jgi:hypothetical protein